MLPPSGSTGVVGAVIPVPRRFLGAAADAGLSHAADYRFWTRDCLDLTRSCHAFSLAIVPGEVRDLPLHPWDTPA